MEVLAESSTEWCYASRGGFSNIARARILLVDEYGGSMTGVQLAQAFSPKVMTALSRTSLGGSAARISMIAKLVEDGSDATLGDAFDIAHGLLAQHYRSEYVFKNAIISKIVYGRHSPATATALLELQMGSSIADVVVVNGTSTIYEVKTDLDQFVRLETQLTDYCSRAEHVYVVTSDARAAAAALRAPEHVGIIGLRPNGSLTTLRKAGSNMKRMQQDHLFAILRTAEASAVLERTHDLVFDKHRARALQQMRSAFRDLPIETAHAETVKQLRSRGRSASQLAMRAALPSSLRALAYTADYSRIGVSRIRDRLGAPAALFMGVDAH